MATLKKITVEGQPFTRKVSTPDLNTLYKNNPETLETLIYGNRKILGVAVPHDHGEGGGELIPTSILSQPLGPYLHETLGGAGDTLGIPLFRGDTISGYQGDPKLIYQSVLTLPGGVSRVRGALYLETAAPSGSTVLYAVLRPPTFHNSKLIDSTAGVRATVQINIPAPGGLFEFAFEGAELERAIQKGFDSRVEFLIYQEGLNFAPFGARLIHLDLWIDDDPAPNTRVALPSDTKGGGVTFADLSAGKLLLETLGVRLRNRINSLFLSTLGAAPGLEARLQNEDRFLSYQLPQRGPHRHLGRYLYRPDRGSKVPAGAVVRYPSLARSSYPRFWGEDISALANADNRQPNGIKLHPSGALGSDWVVWEREVDIPEGLGELEITATLQTATTDQRTQAFIHLGLFRRGNGTPNQIKKIACDFHRTDPVPDPKGFLFCEIEPEENQAFQPNAFRRISGKGVFTNAALKPQNELPFSFIGGASKSPYRITKPIKATLESEVYTGSTQKLETGIYLLRIAFSLFLSDAFSFDQSARLLSFDVVPGKGY